MDNGTDTVRSGSFAAELRVRRRDVPGDVPVLHPDALAHRVLASRGVRSAAELDRALSSLPPPTDLPDIDAAVDRLLAARDAGEAILIVGDYDCDGASSTAVAMLGLGMLGFSRLDYRVPNRFRDGYGLSPTIVRQCLHDEDGAALESPPTLILTVDNGIASVDGVAAAAAAGVDVVVTDHHLPPAILPDAVALVNPNRIDARFASRALAGVGVLFYLLLAIRARLRERRSGQDLVEAAESSSGGADAPLADLLDLVAIGTVADVVPLDPVNRTLVHQGLQRLRAGRSRPGVLALLRTAGREPEHANAETIGFALGPRLNAAGRMADMSVGIACLLAEDEAEAQRLADELDGLNRERRKVERGMREEAELRLAASEVAAALPDGPAVDGPARASIETRFGVVLADPGWHEGVLGILAGRLKERLHRPVVTLTRTDGSRMKGSARSIPGVHVRDVLQAIAAREPGLLIAYGGHAMAAGLTLEAGRVDRFAAAFDEEVARALDHRLPIREWLTDGALASRHMTLREARLLATLGPFGQSFEAPCFDGRFTVLERRIVGKGHLKLRVAPLDPDRLDDFAPDEARALGARGSAPGSGTSEVVLDAIAFDHPDEPPVGSTLRLVYRLDINRWRDVDRLQLLVSAVSLESASDGTP